jgi:hypothetical protein
LLEAQGFERVDSVARIAGHQLARRATTLSSRNGETERRRVGDSDREQLTAQGSRELSSRVPGAPGFGPRRRCRGSRHPRRLDGKTFRTELGKKNSAKGELDEIVFWRGLFRSATREEHGFRDAPYRTAQSGGTIRLAVSSESYEEGTMAWEGMVLGDHVEGKLSWTENHRPVEHWFRATLKLGR